MTAQRREDPPHLVVGAADDGDGGERARRRGRPAPGGVSGRKLVQLDDLGAVAIVQHQVVRSAAEGARQRRLVGARHAALGMSQPLNQRAFRGPQQQPGRCPDPAGRPRVARGTRGASRSNS